MEHKATPQIILGLMNALAQCLTAGDITRAQHDKVLELSLDAQGWTEAEAMDLLAKINRD